MGNQFLTAARNGHIQVHVRACALGCHHRWEFRRVFVCLPSHVGKKTKTRKSSILPPLQGTVICFLGLPVCVPCMCTRMYSKEKISKILPLILFTQNHAARPFERANRYVKITVSLPVLYLHALYTPHAHTLHLCMFLHACTYTVCSKSKTMKVTLTTKKIRFLLYWSIL